MHVTWKLGLARWYTAKNFWHRFDTDSRTISNQCRGGARFEPVTGHYLETYCSSMPIRTVHRQKFLASISAERRSSADIPQSIDVHVHVHLHVHIHCVHLYFEVQYGELLLCYKANEQCWCVMRPLEEMMCPLSNTPLLNNIDCPLLHLCNTAKAVLSTTVRRAVSVVHECGPTCTFQRTSVLRNAEREHIATQTLTFSHDYGNPMFCLNIYCMNS